MPTSMDPNPTPTTPLQISKSRSRMSTGGRSVRKTANARGKMFWYDQHFLSGPLCVPYHADIGY